MSQEAFGSEKIVQRAMFGGPDKIIEVNKVIDLSILDEIGISQSSTVALMEPMAARQSGGKKIPRGLGEVTACETPDRLKASLRPNNLPDDIVIVINEQMGMVAGERGGEGKKERGVLRQLVSKISGEKDSHEVMVWLVEKRDPKKVLSGVEMIDIQDGLRKIGLTGVSIDRNTEAGLIIASGRPRRTPVEKNYAQAPYVPRMESHLSEQLAKRGLRVVSWKEAEERLNTSYPIGPLGRLKNGFGILVEPTMPVGCECLYQITTNGEEILAHQCGNEDHWPTGVEMLEKKANKPVKARDCMDCGDKMLLKIDDKGRREWVCPHCHLGEILAGEITL